MGGGSGYERDIPIDENLVLTGAKRGAASAAGRDERMAEQRRILDAIRRREESVLTVAIREHRLTGIDRVAAYLAEPERRRIVDLSPLAEQLGDRPRGHPPLADRPAFGTWPPWPVPGRRTPRHTTGNPRPFIASSCDPPGSPDQSSAEYRAKMLGTGTSPCST
jgi:hypothetical protein